jgi:hypothetical protein
MGRGKNQPVRFSRDPIMSTAEVSGPERFDREYPATLPARLKWLEERLQIDRSRILRLMGLSDDQAASRRELPWKEIAHEPLAEQAEHLLTQYLSWFDYDVTKARAFMREFAGKVRQGEQRLADYVPAVATATTAAQRDDALLLAIREDDSRLLPALATFLCPPEWNGRSHTKRSPGQVSFKFGRGKPTGGDC